jgi:hypothetical protein
MKAPGPMARRSWIRDVEEKCDSQRCQPTANRAFNYQRLQ